MLVIIVGDDQAMRRQLARALGPVRWLELLCAVPNADGVPPVEPEERLVALLAHRSQMARSSDIRRLRKRFEDRIEVIAMAPDELRGAANISEGVDGLATLAAGPELLVEQLKLMMAHPGAASRPDAGAGLGDRSAPPLIGAAFEAGRDGLYVWDLAIGAMEWPLEPPETRASRPRTRDLYDAEIHPDDRMPLEIALERHFTAQTPFEVAVRRGRGDDGYRLYIDRGALVGSRRDGKFVGLLTEIEDEIRSELNRRLESQRSALAEIGGALGEALSESLVAAFTNLDGALTKVGPKARPPLIDARSALEGALDWTQRLMALGRRQPPNPEYIALQDLVQDLVDPLARRLGSTVELVVVSRDATGIVLADPMHMETVLSILCDRAARQMPHGGTCRLTLTTTHGRDEKVPLPERAGEGRFAKLRIEDEGPSPPEAMSDGGLDPLSHGLPDWLRWTIALATVRSIVKQHEGFIRVLPVAEDHGAAFEIFLPLVTRAPARLRRPETGPNNPVGQGQLVLVVDDDELIRRMSERVLHESGYRVITAVDGRDAIERFKAHRREIELVVLDIIMPEMGGRVVSEHILAMDPGAHFLFTSGYTMSIMDTEFVQAPGRRFLPKPFNAGQLLREVSRALGA